MAGAQGELNPLLAECRQMPAVPVQPWERRKPLGDCSQTGSALRGVGSSVPQQQHPHEQHRRPGSCCWGLVLQSLRFSTLSASPLPALPSAESQTQARSFSPSSFLSYAKDPLSGSHSRCTACSQHLCFPLLELDLPVSLLQLFAGLSPRRLSRSLACSRWDATFWCSLL